MSCDQLFSGVLRFSVGYVTLGMHLCSACNRRTTNALDDDDDGGGRIT